MHIRMENLFPSISSLQWALSEFAVFRGGLINYQATRQSTFTDKIHELGWLNPEFWRDEDNIPVLQHCIVRYYGWVESLALLPIS